MVRQPDPDLTSPDSPLNPPHYVPKDSELVKTLLETYTDVTDEVREPLAIGGGTYVHHIENDAFGRCIVGEGDAVSFYESGRLVIKGKVGSRIVPVTVFKSGPDNFI